MPRDTIQEWLAEHPRVLSLTFLLTLLASAILNQTDGGEAYLGPQ